MDITFLSIAFLILLVLVFLLLFLFKSINKKSFIAEDGSVFVNQSDLELYNRLYEKTKPLFSVIEDNSSSLTILGFDKSFLTKLTTEGFIDLKNLVKYRKQFKSLSELINE